MSYSNLNIIGSLPIKTLLSQVKDLEKKEIVLKANVELQSDKDYVLLVRSPQDTGKEFINKTVVIDKKHEYIDIFNQNYVKELIKKTGHKVKFINSDAFISIAVLEISKKEPKDKSPITEPS